MLIVLIEKFEQEYYQPGSASSPNFMLSFLMGQQGILSTDLVPILGSLEAISQILNGNTKITDTQAKALGVFFKVDSSLFQTPS